jgi:hypothetical protein
MRARPLREGVERRAHPGQRIRARGRAHARQRRRRDVRGGGGLRHGEITQRLGELARDRVAEEGRAYRRGGVAGVRAEGAGDGGGPGPATGQAMEDGERADQIIIAGGREAFAETTSSRAASRKSAASRRRMAPESAARAARAPGESKPAGPARATRREEPVTQQAARVLRKLPGGSNAEIHATRAAQIERETAVRDIVAPPAPARSRTARRAAPARARQTACRPPSRS